MLNFFATPTDEWGDDAVRLTNKGMAITIAVIVAVFVIALVIGTTKKKAKLFTTKQLAFSAMAMSLAVVTSMVKIMEMPMGGSVTLCSMLFIILISYWYGPSIGICTGVAYGLLQFVMEPIFYTLPQMLVDYPLAFGALGIAGFFNKQKYGLITGYVAGVLGRYFFAFISGWIFFGEYAADYNMAAVPYSLVYNGAYLGVEAAITLVVLCIPSVRKALGQVKKYAME